MDGFLKTGRIHIETKNMLYYISYGLYLVFAILSTSFYLKYFIGTAYTIILTVCIILLLLHRLSKGMLTAKQLSWILIAAFAFFALYQISGISVAILLLFIFFSTGIQFENIAKFTIKIELFMLIFIVTSSKIGIIENYIYDVNGRYREYLGFRYALYPMVMMLNIIALYLYVNRDRRKNYLLLALLVFDIYLFLKTGSRLAFYLSLILILADTAIKRRKVLLFKSRMVKWTICSIYLVCCAFSFWTALSYNASIPWMRNLNDFLGNRISMAQVSLLRYGLGAWGMDIDWVGMGLDVYGNREIGSALYVDNFYVHIAQQYGLIFLIILLLIFTISVVIAYKEKDWNMIIILSIFALHGLIDDLMLSIPYNTFLIYIGTKIASPVRKSIMDIYAKNNLRGGNT